MTFNHRLNLKMVSAVVLLIGIAMVLPFICAIYYGEMEMVNAFAFIGFVCIAFGATVSYFLTPYTLKVKSREGFFVAFICWLVVWLIGALPYIFSPNHPAFADALFESAASWSTTGASVLDLSTLPHSLVLWKALCNWLGGVGIIVFTVSIFPMFGIGGQKILVAEIPGPKMEKIAARIGQTAKISYTIYGILTILELCLLLPTNMNNFDALVNTLSTVSTSGIINLNNYIDADFSPYVMTIFTVFTIVGSINFINYFYIYNRQFRRVSDNMELRTYLGLIGATSVIIALSLTFSEKGSSIIANLGRGIFHVVSFGSTSGFTIEDLTSWPSLCKIILIILVIIGGCSFSTSGSLKVIRFVIFFKIMLRGVYKRIHPNSIRPVMLKESAVSSEVASSVTVFIMLYFAIFIFSSLVLSLENFDMETTLSATLGAFSNNGTSFGLLSTGDYSIFSTGSKLYLSILMLAGRLEMYSFVILFSRSFWNSDRAIS